MRRTRATRGDHRLTIAGAALLLVGIALAAGASGAFGAASADRGLSLTVADDQDGYLGIGDETASGSNLTFASGESITVFSLVDNAGAYDTTTTDQVDATLVSFGGDGTTGLAVDVSTDGGGADWLVTLHCGDETEDLAAAEATVEITAVGEVGVVAERTTTEQVDPNCGS